METTGQKIRILRKQKGETLEELGKVLGVGKTAIFQYEHDSREVNNDALIKLSKHFGVSVDWLIGNATSSDEMKDFAQSVEVYLYNNSDLIDEKKKKLIMSLIKTAVENE